PSSEYVASSNSASIPFQAFYVAVNGQATAGTANADATFKVQYQ
ncbi:fimbrial protein, partial [Escherichia coli]|nr:fimbrial protein [Escherichia coli]